jgi:hypothetical protein
LLTKGLTVIPTFSSTPSPDLNAALEHFRNEVFIPLGLPIRQQKSVFKPKYAKQLEHEPIVVKISQNEEFTLTPKKRHEMPTKKEAMDVLHLMVKTGEFRNLFPFLSGLKMAGYSISNNRWEYIIRKVSMAGQLSVILHCAKQSKRTGLSLGEKSIASTLFFELHQTASRTEFKGEQTFAAFKLANEFAALMDQPQHTAKNKQEDPKQQPYVIGTLLELSIASFFHAWEVNKDLPEHIVNYRPYKAATLDFVQKLDANWARGNFAPGTTQAEKIAMLRENLGLYYGIRQASRSVKYSGEAAPILKERAAQLKPILIEQLNQIKNGQIQEDFVSKKLLSGEL